MIKKYVNEICNAFNIAFEKTERCKDIINNSNDSEEIVTACLEYEFWEERMNTQRDEILCIIQEIQDKNIRLELTKLDELQAILIVLQEENVKTRRAN